MSLSLALFAMSCSQGWSKSLSLRKERLLPFTGDGVLIISLLFIVLSHLLHVSAYSSYLRWWPTRLQLFRWKLLATRKHCLLLVIIIFQEFRALSEKSLSIIESGTMAWDWGTFSIQKRIFLGRNCGRWANTSLSFSRFGRFFAHMRSPGHFLVSLAILIPRGSHRKIRILLAQYFLVFHKLTSKFSNCLLVFLFHVLHLALHFWYYWIFLFSLLVWVLQSLNFVLSQGQEII